jgi:hypothetical protein
LGVNVLHGRRLAAALAILLPLLGGLKLPTPARAPSVLRSTQKGPRKCAFERAEASAVRSAREESRREPRAPLILETARADAGASPAPLAPAADWTRAPRALKFCLARDSHSTLAPPAL